MGYNHWLLVVLVLMSVTPVHGHEACYNDTWAYHGQTHSCFKLIRKNLHWPKARDHCSQVQLGRSYGVITRLAKIDDSETNDFIRTLFPEPTWACWIGLSYHSDVGDFRWDGYPTEVPKFTPTHWSNNGRQYVAILIERWKGESSNTKRHFVCQHAARKIGSITCQLMKAEGNSLTTTCTSQENPVKAKCQWNYKNDGESFGHWRHVNNPNHESHTSNTGDIFYKTTCSFTVPYGNQDKFTIKMNMYPDITNTDLFGDVKASVTWRQDVDPPNIPQIIARGGKSLEASSTVVCVADETIDLVCNVHSGSPAVYSVSMSCEFPLNDSVDYYQHTVDATDDVINRRVSRDMHGKNCTCIGNHLTGPVRSSPSTFFVVAKPSDVTCSINVLPYGLMVSCEIGKVFPEASCQWFYHHENDLHSTSVSNSQINDYSHQQHTDVDGFVYYTSICSVTLTPNTTSLRAGLFTVKAKIIPDLRGMYLSMTNDTSTNTQEIVSICKYINCFFIATIDFPLTASVIQQLLGNF